MTVHCYLMAHLCKTKQTLLRPTKIRALQGRLRSAVTLLKAGACPVRQRAVKWGQLVNGAKGRRICQGSDQGGVGNLDRVWPLSGPLQTFRRAPTFTFCQGYTPRDRMMLSQAPRPAACSPCCADQATRNCVD